ncbi:MAG: hypothetical protein ACK559_08020, partial [bacterium]
MFHLPQDRSAHHFGVGGLARPLAVGDASVIAAIEWGRGMEGDRVFLGGLKAVPLLGEDMQQHRTFEGLAELEVLTERGEIMP